MQVTRPARFQSLGERPHFLEGASWQLFLRWSCTTESVRCGDWPKITQLIRNLTFIHCRMGVGVCTTKLENNFALFELCIFLLLNCKCSFYILVTSFSSDVCHEYFFFLFLAFLYFLSGVFWKQTNAFHFNEVWFTNYFFPCFVPLVFCLRMNEWMTSVTLESEGITWSGPRVLFKNEFWILPNTTILLAFT